MVFGSWFLALVTFLVLGSCTVLVLGSSTVLGSGTILIPICTNLIFLILSPHIIKHNIPTKVHKQ